jgi:hypothetical protein
MCRIAGHAAKDNTTGKQDQAGRGLAPADKAWPDQEDHQAEVRQPDENRVERKAMPAVVSEDESAKSRMPAAEPTA